MKTSQSATVLRRDDDEASADQLNSVLGLAERFARMRNRTVKEVVEALLRAETMRRSGYAGTGHLTFRQADVAMRVLGGWIEKARELGD